MTDQGLSFGTKIDMITCFIVGDIGSCWFDPSYTLPTVAATGFSGIFMYQVKLAAAEQTTEETYVLSALTL